MISSDSLNVLTFLLNFGEWTGSIPFKLKVNWRKKQVEASVTSKNIKVCRAWELLGAFTTIVSALETYYAVSKGIAGGEGLMIVAFHGFVGILSLANSMNIRPFIQYRHEWCQLLNNLWKYGNEQRIRKYFCNFSFIHLHYTCTSFELSLNFDLTSGFKVSSAEFRRDEKIINTLVYLWQFCPSVPPIGILLVTAIFPGIYGGTVSVLCRGNNTTSVCNTIYFRIFLTSIYAINAVATALGGLVIGTLALITLHSIHVNISIIQSRSKSNGTRKIEFFERVKLAMAYRQLQIIVGLCDNCFQQFSWPNIQFMGSSILISVLYSVLMFYKIFPANVLLMMVSTCTITGIFIFSIFDYGSRPYVASRKFLARCTKQWRLFPWTRAFFRSCRPIYFKIGQFHRMDRGRGPSLIRFCLQRTFFLMVQSKNHGAND